MSPVKLSESTVVILRNFAKINQGIIFKPGNRLTTINELNTCFASAEVEEEFPELAIYDLNEFLSAFAKMNDPEITFEDTYLILRDTNTNSTVKYFYSEPGMIHVKKTDKTPKLPSEDISFDLTKDQMKSLLEFSGILSSKDNVFSFESDGDKIYARVTNLEQSNSSEFSIEIGSGDGTEFRMVLDPANFVMLEANYKVDIAAEKCIAQFTCSDINLSYIVALNKKKCSFEG